MPTIEVNNPRLMLQFKNVVVVVPDDDEEKIIQMIKNLKNI